MGKKSRKNPRPMNISREERAEMQLTGLFRKGEFAGESADRLKTRIDAIFSRMKAYEFIPVLLSACGKAQPEIQDELDKLIPEWVEERGYNETILKLLERQRLSEADRPKAYAWLEAAGIDSSTIEKARQQSHFYRGYIHTDDSQGLIMIFWYGDHRRRKIRGMNFLLDFNPPWEGAVKDITLLPLREPSEAHREFVEFWEEGGMKLKPLQEAEAKTAVLKHIEVNRKEGIRLPRDLRLARQDFIDNILTLQDAPGAPPFTINDFDTLSNTGKSVEEIRRFEQTVGRRVRLDDGKEGIFLSNPDDDF
jgi:hypothetical protein